MGAYVCTPLSASLRRGNIFAGGVSSAFLVFDEIHTFDPHRGLQTAIALIEHSSKLKLPVCVMSATLPSVLIKKIKNIIKQNYDNIKTKEVKEFTANPYKFQIISVTTRAETCMSFEEVKILRRRAMAFLRYAEEALSDDEYDFVCFACEQAAQLFTKSVMLELIGEIPKLHRVRDMLSLLGNSIPEAEGIVSEFIKRNRERLRALDEAYITSRYLPFKYEREDAETLLDLSKKVIQLGEGILKECRR